VLGQLILRLLAGQGVLLVLALHLLVVGGNIERVGKEGGDALLLRHDEF
jgi:hypothetical protein